MMDGAKKLTSKANSFFIIRKSGLTLIDVRGMFAVFN